MAGGISPDLAGKVALASLRSIIQAATIAAGGLYLGKKGIMTKPGAKLLSTMSMKVTIPCLLFSRVLPSVDLKLISAVWPMLFFPLIFVSVGAFFGWLVVLITRPADDFRAGTIAAVAFGNSTGMPILLLSVIGTQLKYLWDSGTDVAQGIHVDDPVVYLSVYLLTYPIIQWVVGGWLLQPVSKKAPVDPPPVDLPRPPPSERPSGGPGVSPVGHLGEHVHVHEHAAGPSVDSSVGATEGKVTSSGRLTLEEVERPTPSIRAGIDPGTDGSVNGGLIRGAHHGYPEYATKLAQRAADCRKRSMSAGVLLLSAEVHQPGSGFRLAQSAKTEYEPGRNAGLRLRGMPSDRISLSGSLSGEEADNLIGVMDGTLPRRALQRPPRLHPAVRPCASHALGL